MRLEETARAAAARGFERFGTTLTVSPHKNAALVNRLGREAGALHGVEFLDADFKKGDGYGESCRMSRALGIYRQNYCGCRFSAAEAAIERHAARDERKRTRAEARVRI